MRRLVFGLALLGLMPACQEIKTNGSSTSRPVVEGYLASNHPVSVKVTSEALFSDADTSRIISGLNIELSLGEQIYSLTESSDGLYELPSLLVKQDQTYLVRFAYNGEVISSSTLIPGPPINYKTTDTVKVILPFNSSALSSGVLPTFPEPITLTWDNPNGEYYLVVVKNIETNPAPINAAVTDRIFIFRSNPIQTNTYEIRPRQFQYYGRHWVILYKINAEYAALYQSNGNSSLNIKTPYTNVTNGLGIFTGINADTVTIRIKPI